jgi:hypothetical protein
MLVFNNNKCKHIIFTFDENKLIMRGNKRTEMSIYMFIENLRNSIEQDEYDSFMMSLIISYMYGGDIYCCEGDFVVKVDEHYYDIDGIVDEDDFDEEEYIKLHNSHIQTIASEYEMTRMNFLMPFVEFTEEGYDEDDTQGYLDIDINLN